MLLEVRNVVKYGEGKGSLHDDDHRKFTVSELQGIYLNNECKTERDEDGNKYEYFVINVNMNTFKVSFVSESLEKCQAFYDNILAAWKEGKAFHSIDFKDFE